MKKRLCLLACAAWPAPLAAADAPAPAPALENIVVTAQKRSEKVQDIPMTISVLDARALTKLDVRSTEEIAQYVPAVEIAMPSGRGNQPLINIRGIGLNDTNTNNAGPNGIYVDDVYQASPAGQTFQTFDLSRVEVLKGPQGTLYGRNTTGGAINYVTNKPTDQFAASEDVQYGSWNTISTESMINGALSPTINARAVIFYDYSDGFFKDLTDHNTTNGSNDLAFRGEATWQASDNLTLTFNAHGGNVNRRPDEYRFVGTVTGPASFTQCNDNAVLAGQCTDLYGYKTLPGFYSGHYNRDQNLYINEDGGYVRADYSLGDIQLSSLTALEVSHKLHPEDTDAEPNQLIEINYGVKSSDFSEELHASGSGENYHWLAGFYTLDENLKQDQTIRLFENIDQVFRVSGVGNGLAENARILNGQTTDSQAIFGQGDYTILPGLRLTLGGRLTYEHKSFDATAQTAFQQHGIGTIPPVATVYDVQQAISDRAASWRAAIDYKLLPHVLLYANASTGFKSGGFNGGFLANDLAEARIQLEPIRPEYITAYETGFHSDALQGRLRFNSDVFYYSYRDLQVYNLINSPLANGTTVLPLTVLTNAPTAAIKGAEWELDANPVPPLTASAQISYVDATLGHFISSAGGTTLQNLTGKWLPNAPRWDVVLGLDYTIPLATEGTLDFTANATWRTKQFFESNNNPLVAQPAYWLVDLRASYITPGKHWEFAALAKNLTGTQYVNFISDLTATFGILQEVVGPPRYVGAEAKYRF